MACKSCKHLIEEICPIHPYGNAINYSCSLVEELISSEEYMKQFKKDNAGMDCNFIGLNIHNTYCPNWCPLNKAELKQVAD